MLRFSGVGDDGVYVISLLRALSWRVDLWMLCGASLELGLMDVGTTVPDGGVHRGGGLGIHGGEELHGVELLLAWLGS